MYKDKPVGFRGRSGFRGYSDKWEGESESLDYNCLAINCLASEAHWRLLSDCGLMILTLLPTCLTTLWIRSCRGRLGRLNRDRNNSWLSQWKRDSSAHFQTDRLKICWKISPPQWWPVYLFRSLQAYKWATVINNILIIILWDCQLIIVNYFKLSC